jgi:hypothetical protein
MGTRETPTDPNAIKYFPGLCIPSKWLTLPPINDDIEFAAGHFDDDLYQLQRDLVKMG